MSAKCYLAQNYESRRHQRDQSSVEIMSGYPASINDILEANSYVKMLGACSELLWVTGELLQVAYEHV